MKKIFTFLILLMLPFALTANKETIKEVKADEDANATITIGGNTFSRITTSNMNKIKDGAKVILATENPTNGFAFATNDLSNTSSYITRGYLKSKLVDSSNNVISGAPDFIFDVSKVDDSFELSINKSKLLTKNSTYNSSVYYDKDNKLFSNSSYYSKFSLTTSFYGNADDYPIFTCNGKTIYSMGGGYSVINNGYANLYFTSSTSYKTNPNYGTPSIYVLNEGEESTAEEKANAFVTKWLAYNDNFCGNLNDETKRAEMRALIEEYDALDSNVQKLISAKEISSDVTVGNQITYVRNALSIKTTESTSQSVLTSVTSDTSMTSYVLIISLITLSLIGYSLIAKTKKSK